MQPWSQPLLWKGVSGAVACDPYFGNVVLLMGYEGANGSTGAPGMNDESPSAHGTATVTGASVITTSQFKFGSSSLQANLTPNTSTITFPYSADWILSSSNSDQFTIEAWIRPNSSVLTQNLGESIVAVQSGLSHFLWNLYTGTSGNGELTFSAQTAGGTAWSIINSTGITWTPGTWYHVAVDKDATGKVRLYRSGVMVASNTPPDSSIYTGTGFPLNIGNQGTGGGVRPFDGNIDELRITKGVARYANDSGFAVPTAAFPRVACPDPHFSQVVLLMGYEGANGSTGSPGMLDESPMAHGLATVTAPFAITTAQFKFGTASLSCTGSGRLSYNDGPEWGFGTGQFTVETWIYPTSVASNLYDIVAKWNAPGQFGWRLYQDTAGLKWDVSTDGSNSFTDLAGGTLTVNTWFHVAVDYDGIKYRLYVNGVMVSSSTTARNIANPNIILTVGAGPISQYVFSGDIDELRITKGFARYASDAGFAVPTSAFPRS